MTYFSEKIRSHERLIGQASLPPFWKWVVGGRTPKRRPRTLLIRFLHLTLLFINKLIVKKRCEEVMFERRGSTTVGEALPSPKNIA